MNDVEIAASKKLFIKADHPLLKYCGRIGMDDKGWPEFVYPCSFVTLDFVGKTIFVLLENHSVYWNHYVGWILDGEQMKAGLPKAGKTSLCLGKELEEGRHNLMLFKRQDSCHTFSLEGFLLPEDGFLLEPEPLSKRRIEVYGDSVGAGEVSEAIDYVGKEDPFHQGEYSNSWYSYPWITARKLDALLHNISQGGIALMNGMGWFEPPELIGMEWVYDKVQYHPVIGRTSQWNFKDYRPHVVIVALGQNDSHPEDFMKENYNGQKALEWMDHYEGFIRKLRQIYPQAVIVLTTTILCHHDSWDKAIEKVWERFQDEDVHHFCYRRNGSGTPGHIRISEAEEMAKELSDFILSLGEEIWLDESFS